MIINNIALHIQNWLTTYIWSVFRKVLTYWDSKRPNKHKDPQRAAVHVLHAGGWGTTIPGTTWPPQLCTPKWRVIPKHRTKSRPWVALDKRLIQTSKNKQKMIGVELWETILWCIFVSNYYEVHLKYIAIFLSIFLSQYIKKGQLYAHVKRIGNVPV